MQERIEELKNGQTIILRCHGNSMTPKIYSGARLTIVPIDAQSVEVGDIVLCRVKGNVYVHLVTAIKGKDENRLVQISNNHGHVNGWTKAVYGLVVLVENSK